MPVFACRGAVKDSAYRSKPFARAIGMPARQVYTYRIKHPGSCRKVFRLQDGRTARWPEMQEAFVPQKFSDEFHPGGNSLCYMTQIAHLLGAGPIYALGFTLQGGSPYFCGRMHPLTEKPSIYDTDRALHWLSWYESAYPGKLKLLPGFSGPVYDVLQTENLDDYRRRVAEEGSEPQGAAEAARVSGEVHAVGGAG